MIIQIKLKNFFLIKLTIMKILQLTTLLIVIGTFLVIFPISNQNSNLQTKNVDHIIKNNYLGSNTNFKISSISLTAHNYIQIGSNNEFLTCGCATGSGTSGNPYIIQNYMIQGQGIEGIGVNISNTNAYFIVQHIQAQDVPGLSPTGIGFLINNVTNGKLINNVAYLNTGEGFEIKNSNNVQLLNNTADTNSDTGIWITGSHSITLANNTSLTNSWDGFLVDTSSEITFVFNNALADNINGFEIQSSSNINLTDNVANNGNNYPFYITNTPNVIFSGNTYSGYIGMFNTVYSTIISPSNTSQTNQSNYNSNNSSNSTVDVFNLLLLYFGFIGIIFIGAILFFFLVFFLFVRRSRKNKKSLNYISTPPKEKYQSDKDLMKKYNVKSAKIAREMYDGGFPSLELYQKAISEGFTLYEPYRVKEERKEKLLKIMKVSSKISKDDLMKYMGIQNHTILIDWLINLPEGSPITLDGDYVIFKKEGTIQKSDAALSNDIDELLKSFDQPGRKKI